MVQAWIKPIEVDKISEGKDYFLAIRPRNALQSYSLYGTDIKGKRIITSKPGIADRVIGNDKLREILRQHPDHVVIEIPANAGTRWARRKPALKKKG